MSAGAGARAALAIGSPAAVAALAIPLAGGVATLAGAGLPAGDIAAVWAVRGWSAALALALIAGLARAAVGRHVGASAAALGLLLLLAQGWWGASRCYRAHLEVGEGERVHGWAGIQAGTPPPAPPFALEFAARPEEADGPFRLSWRGRDLLVPLGRSVDLGRGLRITVVRWEAAPSVAVLKWNGDIEDQVLTKLHPERRPPEYVQLSFLPHRFYLSSVAAPDAVAAAPSGEAARTVPVVPGGMRLRIQRGKLVLLNREVKKGEDVRFDGRIFRYSDGATWIRIDVERRAGWGLGWAGAALIVAGALMAARRRA